MAASYPTSVKAFTSLVDGSDYPQASHLNDGYDEMTAIEGGLINGLSHPLRFAAAQTLTISAGVVTVTKGYNAVDTEAAAATDDLDTITPGANVGEGSVIILRAANVARVVTLKDGTGNLLLQGDYALDATDKLITLMHDGTNWREVSRGAPSVFGVTSSGSRVTQVAFAATQSASADANTLDDYEEGTWTPADGSGAGLSLTISTTATYIKIGQLVTCWFHVTYPATADGSQAKISGLPFTNGSIQAGGYLTLQNVGATLVSLRCANGATTFQFLDYTASFFLNSQLSGKVIAGAVIYRAAA